MTGLQRAAAVGAAAAGWARILCLGLFRGNGERVIPGTDATHVKPRARVASSHGTGVHYVFFRNTWTARSPARRSVHA